MTLKCNICSFTAAEQIGKQKIHTERNMRKHIREKHSQMLPKSSVNLGLFYKKNIIYEKDREATKSTPKKAKKRGTETGSVPITQYFPASPALSAKKRRSARTLVPEKPQKGEEKAHAQADLRIIKDEPAEITLGIDEITYEESEDEEDTQVENLETLGREKLVAKKTEEKAKVPEASKKEFMSPDAQDLRGIVDTFDDHMEHEEQEIDEETEEERRLRNFRDEYERIKPYLKREIHGFVLQLPSRINPGYFDLSSEFITIEQRHGVKWEECPTEHLLPSFAAENREWRPAVLEDEHIGKIKAYRVVTQSGKYSGIYLARLLFSHYTPFTRRLRHDKSVQFSEQFYYIFCHTHEPNRTLREHNKQKKQFESNRSIQTKKQFATILRQSQCDETATLRESRIDAKQTDISMKDLGLAMSDDEDEEKENANASKRRISENQDNFEVELDNLQLSSSQHNSTGIGLEVSDEEDEDDESVDGKQARKEWNRRQKAILLDRLAKSMINGKHLKERRAQAKDELDRLTQNNRHNEIDQRIEDPEYKCSSCHRTLDSVEGVPKEAHERICAETRKYLNDRRN